MMINMYKEVQTLDMTPRVINHWFACVFQRLDVTLWTAPLDTRKSKC